MGKVRSSNIKILARTLVQKYEDKFSRDFEHNKRTLEKIADMKSKRFRNRVAGYITTLIKVRDKREAMRYE